MHFLPKKKLITYSTLSAKGALIACSLFSPIALAACISNALATTPSSAFTDHNDGTVTHKTTGLMWKVCSEGQAWAAGVCTGVSDITAHTWQDALQIPETLNAGAGFPPSGVDTPYNDWRLPNRRELTSIVELTCSPAINETIFPNAGYFLYWSSSPYARVSNGAWGVSFGGGHDRDDHRYSLNQVRLVRDGQ